MRHFFFLLLFFGSCSIVHAQELANVNYGLESPMRTNKVYHLYYSKDDLLYICTDNGLWSYNGLVFKKHPLSNRRSMGLTDVQEDERGDLFIKDFKGNIYQLNEKGTLDLYPFPPLVKGKIIGFKIVKNTKYFYTSRNVYCERANGEWLEVMAALKMNFVIEVLDNGIVELVDKEAKACLYKLTDTSYQLLPIKQAILRDKFKKSYENAGCIVTPNNHIINDKGELLVDLSLASTKLKPIQLRNINNRLLVACRSGLYDVASKQIFFQDQYITGTVADREGNIWVSMLNGGLCKIHNLGYQVYPIDNIKKGADFILEHDGHVVYSDLMGNLYKNSKQKTAFELFYTNTLQATVKNIFFDPYSQQYISSGNEYNVFDTTFKQTLHEESYGAVAPMKGRPFFFQTRLARSIHFDLKAINVRASYRLNKEKDEVIFWEEEQHKIIFSQRLNGGKYFSSKNPNIQFTALLGEKIFYYIKDSLYCFNYKKLERSTIGYYPQLQNLWVKNYELFALDSLAFLKLDKKGQVQHRILLQNGMEEGINYISVNDDYICLSTKSNIHVLRAKDLKYQCKFSTENGITSVDFVKSWVYGHHLYVNGSKGISKIDLKADYHQGQPLLALTMVRIDSQQQVGHCFAYNQNNIELFFDVKSYTADGNIQWRINGRNWQTLLGSDRIALNDLKNGAYKIEAVFKNKLGASSNKVVYSFQINKPYWQKVWFWLLIISVVTALVWWQYQRRLKQIQIQNDLENKLVASQMTALKSQMNPHFIFNALNSIQSLVRFNKNKEAYKYINKFAMLLRETLHYSDKDSIPLEREISMLQNYLDMEKMRFDEELDFSIEANCSTNISIPSMIIQPFVENAIKHGLLHKVSGQKQLWVTFEERDQNSLICTVIDNGIGRVRAREIATSQKRIGASFSTQATQKRLELLQELQHSQLGVSYTDLYNDSKEPLGTKVEIIIPVD
ncbi:MAG: histidine kinase [Aureispira sp.]